MSTARWSTPGTVSANLNAGTANSLANGSSSAFLTAYDNSTNLDLYASVAVALSSITPTSGGSISLSVFSGQGSTAPDNTASVGGGDVYTVPLTAGASAKSVIFPMVRLYPQKCYISLTNNSGVTLGTGNTVYVQPFDESSA